jgi:hypothetical protein
MLRELPRDGGLISGAGADLEHYVIGFELEQIGHQSDDVRLRDRLLETDGQGAVEIGVRLKLDGDELVARYAGDDFHHLAAEHGAAGVGGGRRGLLGDLLHHLLAQAFE